MYKAVRGDQFGDAHDAIPDKEWQKPKKSTRAQFKESLHKISNVPLGSGKTYEAERRFHNNEI